MFHGRCTGPSAIIIIIIIREFRRDASLEQIVAGGIQTCTEDVTVPQIIRQCKLSATAALTLQL